MRQWSTCSTLNWLHPFIVLRIHIHSRSHSQMSALFSKKVSGMAGFNRPGSLRHLLHSHPFILHPSTSSSTTTKTDPYFSNGLFHPAETFSLALHLCCFVFYGEELYMHFDASLPAPDTCWLTDASPATRARAHPIVCPPGTDSDRWRRQLPTQGEEGQRWRRRQSVQLCQTTAENSQESV